MSAVWSEQSRRNSSGRPNSKIYPMVKVAYFDPRYPEMELSGRSDDFLVSTKNPPRSSDPHSSCHNFSGEPISRMFPMAKVAFFEPSFAIKKLPGRFHNFFFLNGTPGGDPLEGQSQNRLQGDSQAPASLGGKMEAID